MFLDLHCTCQALPPSLHHLVSLSVLKLTIILQASSSSPSPPDQLSDLFSGSQWNAHTGDAATRTPYDAGLDADFDTASVASGISTTSAATVSTINSTVNSTRNPGASRKKRSLEDQAREELGEVHLVTPGCTWAVALALGSLTKSLHATDPSLRESACSALVQALPLVGQNESQEPSHHHAAAHFATSVALGLVAASSPSPSPSDPPPPTLTSTLGGSGAPADVSSDTSASRVLPVLLGLLERALPTESGESLKALRARFPQILGQGAAGPLQGQGQGQGEGPRARDLPLFSDLPSSAELDDAVALSAAVSHSRAGEGQAGWGSTRGGGTAWGGRGARHRPGIPWAISGALAGIGTLAPLLAAMPEGPRLLADLADLCMAWIMAEMDSTQADVDTPVDVVASASTSGPEGEEQETYSDADSTSHAYSDTQGLYSDTRTSDAVRVLDDSSGSSSPLRALAIGACLALPAVLGWAYQSDAIDGTLFLNQLEAVLELGAQGVHRKSLMWDARGGGVLVGHVLMCGGALVHAGATSGVPLRQELLARCLTLLSSSSAAVSARPSSPPPLQVTGKGLGGEGGEEGAAPHTTAGGAKARADARGALPASLRLCASLGMSNMLGGALLFPGTFHQTPHLHHSLLSPFSPATFSTGAVVSDGVPVPGEANASVNGPLLLEAQSQETARSVVQRLVEVVRSDGDPRVRRYAAWALGFGMLSLQTLLRQREEAALEAEEEEAREGVEGESESEGGVGGEREAEGRRQGTGDRAMGGGAGMGRRESFGWRKYPLHKFTESSSVRLLSSWLLTTCRALPVSYSTQPFIITYESYKE